MQLMFALLVSAARSEVKGAIQRNDAVRMARDFMVQRLNCLEASYF